MTQQQLASWGLGWVSAAKEVADAALASEVDGQTQGQLAVLAMHNARTALTELLGADHVAIVRIDQVAPDLKQCRDMLSHFEDYVVGSGRLQSKSATGERVPWWVMWGGGNDCQELAFVTKTGNPAQTTTYWVNIQDTLHAIAAALVISIEELQLGQCPRWLEEITCRA